MKLEFKSILVALLVIIAFLILSKLIPNAKKSSGSVNYAPNGFKETIHSSVNGTVTATLQQGLFYVTINDKKLPFSYDVFYLPENWKESYPKPFIQIGDSIYKNAGSDTFYLIRGSGKWLYVLPR